jgi:hypothetical protein
VVILEEAAFVRPNVFSEVVAPVLLTENTALLAISTAQDEFNYYSRLLELKDAQGQPLFRVIRIGLACEACVEKGQGRQCKHRSREMPAWRSRDRQERIGAMVTGSGAAERELLGLVAGSGYSFIFRQWVRELRERPRVTDWPRPPGVLYLAIDPSGGGALSDYALVTTTFQERRVTVGAARRSGSARPGSRRSWSGWGTRAAWRA